MKVPREDLGNTMNPALSQEFHLFCEQEHPQRHANTNKKPYCVYGTLKIVHDESVKVYLLMYNGNVQQNPLCVVSCITKEFSMSPLFSSTIFDPDANSVLLRAHLCTAVDSMRRKPFVRFFIKMQIQYSY